MRSTVDLRTDRTGTTGLGRFELRAVLGWAAVLLGAVPFLLLWLLVQASWPPLAEVDAEVAAALNEAVSTSPALVSVLRGVTDLGGTAFAVLVMTLATAFLLIRRQRRLAAFVATAGLGLAVLGPLTKSIVDRARPVVDIPVVQTPSNASFPSGHSMTALVVWSTLLLVSLPSVRRGLRPWLIAATALLVVVIGFTRLALGVHFVSDVLAGWALGAGWLVATVAAFRAWQHDLGRHPDEALDPLDVPPDEAAHAAPAADPGSPGGRASALRLLGALLALLAVVAGLGVLVTAVLVDTWVGRADRAAVRWIVALRDPALSAVTEVVGAAGGTPAVIGVGLALMTLGLAVAASWRPVAFVVIALLGELAVYGAASQLVGRLRPEVPDLTVGLPSAASWPSGHVAAAVTVYGALAGLAVAYGRSRWRWATVALPVVLGIAVGVSRIYVAAHYPTDVLAGLVLGATWVWICAWVLLPSPGRGVRAGTAVRPAAEPPRRSA
ncbi:phosphatase PAP2 family protein [Geodermatophilus sp. SYSU D01186]